MKTKNFTLIELLVVIVIIAILAAILLPALMRAKKSARIIVCVGNNSQMSRATIMYLDDNNSWFPNQNINGGRGTKWHTMYAYVGARGKRSEANYSAKYRMVNPYLDYEEDSMPVAQCPLDNKPMGGKDPYSSTHEQFGTSYCGNARSGQYKDLERGGIDTGKGCHIRSISTDPTLMVVFSEIGGFHMARGKGIANQWATSWHGNQEYTLSFLDGHVANTYIYEAQPNDDEYAFDSDL